MKTKCQWTYNEVAKILKDKLKTPDQIIALEAIKQVTLQKNTLQHSMEYPYLKYGYPIESLMSAIDQKNLAWADYKYSAQLLTIFEKIFASGTRVEKKVLEAASVYSHNGLQVAFIDHDKSGEYSNGAASYSSLRSAITFHKEHLASDFVFHEYFHAVLDSVFLCNTLPYNDQNERALYKVAIAKTFNNMNQFIKVINANFNSCVKMKDVKINSNYSPNIDDSKELSSLVKSIDIFHNKMATAFNNEVMYSCENYNVLNKVYVTAKGLSLDPALEAEAIVYLFSNLGFQNPLTMKLLEPMYDYFNNVVEPAVDAYIDHHKQAARAAAVEDGVPLSDKLLEPVYSIYNKVGGLVSDVYNYYSNTAAPEDL